jgi:hypothetical protein
MRFRHPIGRPLLVVARAGQCEWSAAEDAGQAARTVSAAFPGLRLASALASLRPTSSAMPARGSPGLAAEVPVLEYARGCYS